LLYEAQLVERDLELSGVGSTDRFGLAVEPEIRLYVARDAVERPLSRQQEEPPREPVKWPVRWCVS
jgi:hypothetical protein